MTSDKFLQNIYLDLIDYDIIQMRYLFQLH